MSRIFAAALLVAVHPLSVHADPPAWCTGAGSNEQAFSRSSEMLKAAVSDGATDASEAMKSVEAIVGFTCFPSDDSKGRAKESEVAGVQEHRSASFKLNVEQHDTHVRATFAWVEFGNQQTEVVAGDNGDCAARSVTLCDASPAAGAPPCVYIVPLSANIEQLTDGTESRLDGTWSDERCEIEAYLRNPR